MLCSFKPSQRCALVHRQAIGGFYTENVFVTQTAEILPYAPEFR